PLRPRRRRRGRAGGEGERRALPPHPVGRRPRRPVHGGDRPRGDDLRALARRAQPLRRGVHAHGRHRERREHPLPRRARTGWTGLRTQGQRGITMTKTAKTLIWAWLVVLSLAVAGCWGAMKTSPDNPTGAGGLTPNVEDKDAGLVALAPGFDVRSYGVIAVDRFPVTDLAIKDEDDRKLAAEMQSYLQSELVRRLRDTGLFQRVVNLSEAEFKPEADKTLRLEGTITRRGGGSQAARAFFGAYGAGGTRAQAD